MTSIQYKPTDCTPKEKSTEHANYSSALVDGEISAVNISFAGEHLDSTQKMTVAELQTTAVSNTHEDQPMSVIPIEKNGTLNLQSTDMLPINAIMAASPNLPEINDKKMKKSVKRNVVTSELPNRFSLQKDGSTISIEKGDYDLAVDAGKNSPSASGQ